MGVHTDLLSNFVILNIEGIAQATAALFLLQFLIGNFAGLNFERNCPSLLYAYFCFMFEFLTRVGKRINCAPITIRPSKTVNRFCDAVMMMLLSS